MCVYGEWVRRSSQVHQHLLRSRDMERLWSTPVTARGKVLLGKSQDNLPQPNIHRQILRKQGKEEHTYWYHASITFPKQILAQNFFNFDSYGFTQSHLELLLNLTATTLCIPNFHALIPDKKAWKIYGTKLRFIYLFLIKRETMVASCIRLFAKEYCEHPAQFYTLTIENNR